MPTENIVHIHFQLSVNYLERDLVFAVPGTPTGIFTEGTTTGMEGSLPYFQALDIGQGKWQSYFGRSAASDAIEGMDIG